VCQQLSIKVKHSDFRVFSRSAHLRRATASPSVIFETARGMLEKALPLTARLMGVRAAQLLRADSLAHGVDAWFSRAQAGACWKEGVEGEEEEGGSWDVPEERAEGNLRGGGEEEEGGGSPHGASAATGDVLEEGAASVECPVGGGGSGG
jgi:hypothetical protein